MLLLIIGLVLFFAIHSISIINVAWRDSIAQRLGVGPWRVLYSLMSLAGLVVLIWGYGIAGSDPVILYTSPDWLRHINFLLMLFVFPLFVATYLPGRIKTVTKHPTFTQRLKSGPSHTYSLTVPLPMYCYLAVFWPGLWPGVSR